MGDARQTGTRWQQRGLDPAYALQVFGMRRAGNHAIIDWLLRNAPDGATGGLFYNNCRPDGDPRDVYATFDVYDGNRKIVPAEGREPARRLKETGPHPMVVVSYEDRMPGGVQKTANGFGAADFDHTVVIYRSFLNWAASLLTKLRKNDQYGPLERMHQISRAIRTYAQGLDSLAQPGVVGICYDDWMGSTAYRRDTLARLALTPHALDRGKVQRFGGGSSFQSRINDPADLHTLLRGDEMAHDPEYLMLMWLAAHDFSFMKRLARFFESDAERLISLAEDAQLDLILPTAKEHP